MRFLRTAQQLERTFIHCTFADLPVEPRHGFRIVVENVRASRAFADGVQIERAHDALQVLIPLAAKKLDAQPIWPRMRGRRRHWHGRYVRDDMERRGHWAQLKPSFYAIPAHRTNCTWKASTVPSLFLWRRPSDGLRSENAETDAQPEVLRGSWL